MIRRASIARRADVPLPPRQLSEQRLNAVGLGLGEILLFPEILCQVAEVDRRRSLLA